MLLGNQVLTIVIGYRQLEFALSLTLTEIVRKSKKLNLFNLEATSAYERSLQSQKRYEERGNLREFEKSK